MILSKALAAVLTAAGWFVQDAIAHSVKRNPLSAVATIENAIINTPSHRVHSDSSFDVRFVLSTTKQEIRLELQPNRDLFSDDATIQIMAADGTVRRAVPVNRRDHRVFRGDSFVRREGSSDWHHAGWARINMHRDGPNPVFDGVFTIDHNHHHVQTKATYQQTSVDGDPDLDDGNAADEYMVVWRDTDIQPTAHHDDLKRDLGRSHATCASDNLLYNRNGGDNVFYRSLEEATQDTSAWQISPRALFGRQSDMSGGNGAGVNLADSIGSTQGCPSTRKVALIGVATDCTYTAALGSDEAVQQNVIQLVNAASQLYESTFNISLAIQNLTISEKGCPSSPPASAPWNRPCSDDFGIESRLSTFSKWRGQWQDTNAFWTLLSTCPSGPAVGLAWLGAVCQEGSSTRGNETSAAANVVIRTSTEWLVFAHETGHTFGAVHDCDSESCGDGSVQRQECCPLSSTPGSCDAKAQFIMNPSTGNGITKFSPCSIGNICSFLGRSPSRTKCLSDNKGVTTFTGSQCGNGIVERGEDCDCGGDAGCANNPCCDPNTCKYTAGSVCDPSNEECCTDQCTFMTNGTVCRASTGLCDPEETCTGTSAGCPADINAPDGQSCGNGLTCASGRCTSRDQQCKTFIGKDATTCSSSGCVLSCHSTELGPNQCYVLRQYFLDGTPCEGGGKCFNGNCQGVSLSQQILDWINDNKQIAIPVICVVGGLILIALISCVWSCLTRACRRRSRASRPPPLRRNSGWGAAAAYFGPGTTPPIRPGPAYAPLPTPPHGGMGMGDPYQPFPAGGGRWEPMRQRSFRYA
ncbi:hypothetical protein VTJ83DRAFT_6622 [Remersonia thermophila]|uniref:Disintegrin and metalloproteinase domain-containing protein B n=1 Tax=Remersonia thermophila TaxID=72144 RepID=A0ABR4D586_9PEZI